MKLRLGLLDFDFDLNIYSIHSKGVMICYKNFQYEVRGYDIYCDIFEKKTGTMESATIKQDLHVGVH